MFDSHSEKAFPAKLAELADAASILSRRDERGDPFVTLMEVVVSEEDLQKLYTWVDEIPLSRTKKNIARDFRDGGKCHILDEELL